MQLSSRYLKQISFAVSLLTLSTLSISCSSEPASTSGNLSSSTTASSNSICDNAFVPNLPYSQAGFSENYQLVLARLPVDKLDDLFRIGREATEEAAKNSRKIPIDDVLNTVRQSGLLDDSVASMRNILQENNIPLNLHQPLLNYGEERVKAVTIMAVEDALSNIPNHSSPASLEAYLEQQVSQQISSLPVPTDDPGINETINLMLNAQSRRIASEATRIAISQYCR